MKPLTGGLIGAALAALAVFGWTGRAGAREDAGWSTTANPSAVHLVSNAAQPGLVDPALALQSGAATTMPLAVSCEPGQRAVLRQVAGPSGVVTEGACVTDARSYTTTAPAGFVSQDVIDPTAVRPVRYVTREAAPERVVYRERPARRAASTRSWQKRALVIGGSAGAGAGIGALAGGKKGALIGAAVGGGAGTVYELLRK